MAIEIVRLPPSRYSEAVDVLTSAFLAEEQFVRLFNCDESSTNRVAAAFRLGCDVHAAYRFPLLAALDAGRVVGVLALQVPPPNCVVPLWPRRLWFIVRGHLQGFRTGRDERRRSKAYDKAIKKLRPGPPFCYVTYIGVLADAQGKGIGRQLLDDAYALVTKEDSFTRLVLDTFNPAFASSLKRRGWRNRELALPEGGRAFSCLRERTDAPEQGGGSA